ncbi:MAG TPA: RecB-like helicase [Campylobacterales bacterium]|nr:RecB-like helicase [Campylobacterales bacterium]
MSFQPYLAYSASAGSGKTFALSVRYISLLFLGEEPSTILAATFTNKAALEMKQRVVKSLMHLEENPPFLEAIMEQTGMEREALLAKQPEVLANFLASSNFIVTLDSFFTSILRSASLYVDIEPDFVTKEIDESVKEANFLEEMEANSLLWALVQLAITIEDKRFLKIFDLMQSFYKIDPLLPQTVYTVQKLERVESEIDKIREALHRSVIASGASPTAIKNFAPTDVRSLFKKSVFKKATLLDHNNYKKYVEKFPEIDELFWELKEALRRWAEAKEQVILHNLFELFGHYKNANITTAKQLGVLSFDDLSYFTYRLLHESITKEFLYFKIDSRFKHILLDEFQDTSTLQFLLLKPLIDEVFAGGGEFRSFFYVGDTKQSLYRFRGGVEELFDAVAHHPDYAIVVDQMDTNYRSSQQVVRSVNAWFEGKMRGFFPANYREEANEGYVEVVESEEPVDEAIAKLQWLLAQGVELSEIAFLVATNKDGAMIQEACYAQGIATRLKTSSSLKHLPNVAALVAMVRYLWDRNPLDAEAMMQYTETRLERVDLRWFDPFMSPLTVLHHLIEKFAYFRGDLNLLKLLEFASGFEDIPSFLEEFALSAIDVASHSKEGAMIMTIHGSKGLEFAHVIVVDKLKGNAHDRSALLYDYDDSLHVKRLFYKMGERQNFDETYRMKLEQQKELTEKDRLNVLYVALTRAVESMIVIKKPKGSTFELLGMETLQRGRLCPVTTELTPSSRDEDHPPTTITHYGVQEVATSEDEEEKDYEAILFGMALHYTLEMMGEFTLESLSEALIATQNRYGLMVTAQKLQAIEYRVQSLLEHPAFQSLLSEALSINKEQSLSFEEEFKQIDLLLEYDEHCVVIDYKSSKKYHLKHCAQVGYYKKAIYNITGKFTQGVIVYLLDEGIELFEV